MDPPRLYVPRTAGGPPPDVVRQGPAALALTEMGIDLPPSPMPPALQVLREIFAGTFVNFRDVLGEEVSADRVIEWMRSVPTEAMLKVCSILSRYASVHSVRGRVQVPLVDWLMSDIYRPRIRWLLSGGPVAPRQFLFHHEQLLLAAKLAILYGTDDPVEALDVETRHKVGRILLAINDLILSVGEGVDPESDPILGLVVRSLTINATEEPRYQIARAYEMFVERGASEPAIDQFFHDRFGVGVAEFMAFGMFTILPVFPFHTPDPPDLDISTLAVSGRVVPDRVTEHPEWEPLLDQVAASRDWFRQALDDGKIGDSSFHPFQRRPFYRAQDGSIFPISHRFLFDRIGNGVLWMLHTEHADAGGHAVQDFMGVVGRSCVEPTALEALEAVTPKTGDVKFINGATLPTYRSPGRGDVHGADAYLVEGSRLIIIEITASALPAATLLSGDGARFRNDFERKMVVKTTDTGREERGKLGQLDRVVHDLLDGHLQLPDVDLATIDTIYPVMLSLQPVPQLLNIWREVDKLFKKHKLFRFDGSHPRVAPVRLLSFEDLELIGGDLAAGNMRLADVLDAWLNDILLHDSGLKNHLLRGGHVEVDNPHMQAIFRRWAESTRPILVGAGLIDADATELAAELEL